MKWGDFQLKSINLLTWPLCCLDAIVSSYERQALLNIHGIVYLYVPPEVLLWTKKPHQGL